MLGDSVLVLYMDSVYVRVRVRMCVCVRMSAVRLASKSCHCFALPYLSLLFQEPVRSRAPQLHLEYKFYRMLGNSGQCATTAL